MHSTLLREVEDDRAIVKDPNILGGEAVFRGTRVPFKVLTDYFGRRRNAAIEEARSSLASQLRMRVLIDECAAKALKLHLAQHGHKCSTVLEAGWSEG
jgi:hypothetical protein